MNIDKSSKEKIVKSLTQIAEDLILNKAIRINNSYYSFIDIEVYYWHNNHQDEFASGVNHFKPKGEFEAHRYGIDLSLGNEQDIEFGGILICGLFDNQHKENRVIEKSHVVRTFINQLHSGNNKIEVVEYKNPWHEVFRSKRLNLGKDDTENKKTYSDVQYKFLAKDSNLFLGYKGKEQIFRDSDLTDIEMQKLLGYKIKR